MAFTGIGKLIKDLVTDTPADTDYFVFGNSDIKKITLPNLKKVLGVTKNQEDIKALNSALALKTYLPESLGINQNTTLNKIVVNGLLPPGGTIEVWINDETTYGREIRAEISKLGTNFFGYCYITRVVDGQTFFLQCYSYDNFSIFRCTYSNVNSVGWGDWKKHA